MIKTPLDILLEGKSPGLQKLLRPSPVRFKHGADAASVSRAADRLFERQREDGFLARSGMLGDARIWRIVLGNIELLRVVRPTSDDVDAVIACGYVALLFAPTSDSADLGWNNNNSVIATCVAGSSIRALYFDDSTTALLRKGIVLIAQGRRWWVNSDQTLVVSWGSNIASCSNENVLAVCGVPVAAAETESIVAASVGRINGLLWVVYVRPNGAMTWAQLDDERNVVTTISSSVSGIEEEIASAVFSADGTKFAAISEGEVYEGSVTAFGGVSASIVRSQELSVSASHTPATGEYSYSASKNLYIRCGYDAENELLCTYADISASGSGVFIDAKNIPGVWSSTNPECAGIFAILADELPTYFVFYSSGLFSAGTKHSFDINLYNEATEEVLSHTLITEDSPNDDGSALALSKPLLMTDYTSTGCGGCEIFGRYDCSAYVSSAQWRAWLDGDIAWIDALDDYEPLPPPSDPSAYLGAITYKPFYILADACDPVANQLTCVQLGEVVASSSTYKASEVTVRKTHYASGADVIVTMQGDIATETVNGQLNTVEDTVPPFWRDLYMAVGNELFDEDAVEQWFTTKTKGLVAHDSEEYRQAIAYLNSVSVVALRVGESTLVEPIDVSRATGVDDLQGSLDIPDADFSLLRRSGPGVTVGLISSET